MSESGTPSNKVAKLIEQHELGELGDELRRYWTGEGVERMSLRDLADYFNKRILESEMERAGMSTLAQEVDTVYANLTDESVSVGVETDTKNTLSESGIDPDELRRAFVSYQTVRTYLKEYQDAKYEEVSTEEKILKDIESLKRLETRSQSVATDKIEKLMSADRIAASEFEVFVDMSVLCQNCGKQYPADEFIESGGCDCQQTSYSSH